jgi:hypothetical protein
MTTGLGFGLGFSGVFFVGVLKLFAPVDAAVESVLAAVVVAAFLVVALVSVASAVLSVAVEAVLSAAAVSFDEAVLFESVALESAVASVVLVVASAAVVGETDQESNPIGYFLDMEKWDESGLGIRINYTDPLQVGKGNDQIMTTLKNPDLFVSAASGKPVPQKSATSVKFSPPQVPKGVSEDRLLKDATNTNNAMLGMIIIQLLGQLF